MSDIEREEFEQAFLNQYTDFERFENGEYMDDFLQQSWIGWQASRQALEGEPAMWSLSFNGKPANHFTTYPTRGKAEDYIARCKIGEKEPEKVNIEVVPLYTHPASADKWIKCSEQRPNVLDVWIKMTDGSVVACWAQLDGDFYWKGGGSESFILEHTVTHWKPRQEEQGHE
jgi:hypothetical protein